MDELQSSLFVWLSVNNVQLSMLALLNVPECVKDPPQWLLGASCFTSHFLSPFLYSTSLCNSAHLLPGHSLMFLSGVSFESAASLFHFLFLRPPSLSSDERQAAVHVCVVLQRPEDEQMWHSPIIFSLFTLVSLFAVTSPTLPLHVSLCPSPLRMMGNVRGMGEAAGTEYGVLRESPVLFVLVMCVYVVV